MITYALDANTGAERWRFLSPKSEHFDYSDYKEEPLFFIKPVSPAVSPNGGTVFVVSADFYLYALDANTGAKKWNFTVGIQLWGGPVVSPDGGTVFIGSNDHDPSYDGSYDYDSPYDGSYDYDPSGPSGTSILYAVDANTGAEKWNFTAADDVFFICGNQR